MPQLPRFLPLAIALVGAAPAAAHETAAVFDREAALKSSQAALGNVVGDYALTDGSGRSLRFSSYRGKPLVVNFIYTGCTDVCPVTTRFLARAIGEAQRVLGASSFAALTVGFNAPFDSPVAMSDFARRNAAALPGWEFASAPAGGVDGLARDLGFSYVATAGGFDHIAQTTIIDGAGRVYRQVYGEEPDARQLVDPLRELIAQTPSSAPVLPLMLDKIRLWCTVYDPSSGRYRLDYALFVEIFTGLTVVGGVAFFLYRERTRA